MVLKKTIYIILTIFLGLLLTETLGAWVEISYIEEALNVGGVIQTKSFFGFSFYLPIYFQLGLYLVGLVGGYFLGQSWWRIVYVEKRHWRFRKKK